MSANSKGLRKPSTVSVAADTYQQRQTLPKYFLIGVMASAIDVIVFMVMLEGLGTTPLFAHSISVPVSVLFSFSVNARHNFRVNDYMALRLLSFVLVCIVGYLASYSVILATMQVGESATLGKIVSLPFVFVVQYVLNSRITFRGSPGHTDLEQG